MTTNRTYGNKYDGALTIKEIATRIRQDVKAAVKAGALPKGLKVSVRTSYTSMSSAITVRIREIPGVQLNSSEFISHQRNSPHVYVRCARYSPEASAVQETLERIVEAYNHDGSDSRFDHFDVKFYGSVEFDVTAVMDEYDRLIA